MSRERRIQKQLDFAQQITHIGSWEWDVASDQVPARPRTYFAPAIG